MREKWNLRKEDRQNWLVFAGSILISFILSIVVILLDTRTIPLVDNLPDWALTNVDIAVEVLGALVGTLLAVATFTFSAMLTIVSLYSSNFSPRVVENYLLNKVALRTLGIFLGGFVYSVSSLVFMRQLPDDARVLAATVAWIYAIAAIVYFIKFVFQTANFVQLEKLVSKVYLEAEQVFDKHIDYFDEWAKLDYLPEFDSVYQYTIKADTNAYIDYIRFKKLKDICEEYRAVCVMQVRIGTFVSRYEPIAIVYTNQKAEDETQLSQQINQIIAYKTEPSAVFDPYYSRSKMVDIALRAISPAVNDPNTAIHVLHYKSLLEAKLAGLAGRYAVLGESGREQAENSGNMTQQYEGCILYEYNDFLTDLHKGYWQLVQYMKEDISCMTAIFEGLLVVAYATHEENLSDVKEYSQYVYEKTHEYFPLSFDQKRIEEKHQAVLNVRK